MKLTDLVFGIAKYMIKILVVKTLKIIPYAKIHV